ncbi:YusW family protein [Bacillus sp. 1P06AnD]|uniref:YusW family protein n=1 Tax=Bacillus sp. 1P06AnD TaxID=3132208 RepID=UPI0039A02032
MKHLALAAACFSILALAACNNNGDGENKTPSTNPPTENNAPDGTNAQNHSTTAASLPFTSFDLDVDYDYFQSFEVEYDNDDEGLTAIVKDELNNRTIKGDEALGEMQNKFLAYKFDQNSPDEDVIKEVLASYDLKDNFKKFELDITFSDGTEKEYHITK